MNEKILDGRCMTSRARAHGYIAGVLDLPVWYGANLDALADCLGELGPGTVVTLTHASAMREALGPYAPRLERVFEDLSGSAGFLWYERED